MGMRALQIDSNKVLTKGGVGLLSGLAQRMAWNRSNFSGFLTTGIIAAVGVLGPSLFGGGRQMEDVFDATTVSATTVAGYQASDFLFQGNGGSPARLMAAQRHAQAIAARGQRGLPSPTSKHPGQELRAGEVVQRI